MQDHLSPWSSHRLVKQLTNKNRPTPQISTIFLMAKTCRSQSNNVHLPAQASKTRARIENLLTIAEQFEPELPQLPADITRVHVVRQSPISGKETEVLPKQ